MFRLTTHSLEHWRESLHCFATLPVIVCHDRQSTVDEPQLIATVVWSACMTDGMETEKWSHTLGFKK